MKEFKKQILEDTVQKTEEAEKERKKKMFNKIRVILLLSVVFILYGCGAKSEETQIEGYKNDVPVKEVRETVKEALGDNYWPSSEIDEGMLKNIYGIDGEIYEEFSGEMPMISAQVDTFLVIKAKEGKASQVEEALKSYQKKLQEDTLQYPMNLGKIQASQIGVFGNYVCFSLLGGDTTSQEEQGEDAVIKACQAENEKAFTAVKTLLADS